jgi:hypothetical protein
MRTRDESDLRSLDRRSMYSIFAPLDANDRLPRELLEERPSPRGFVVPPRNGWLDRKDLARAIWLPAVLLLLTAAALGWLDAPAAFAAAGVIAIGLIGIAFSGRRKHR